MDFLFGGPIGEEMSDDKIFQDRLFFSSIEPISIVPRRKGRTYEVIATFDQKVEKMEVRRGRVCVLVGGMWRIVPVPKTDA
jgi:hypothetical protein